MVLLVASASRPRQGALGRVMTPRLFLRHPTSGSHLLSSTSFLGSVIWKAEGEVPHRGNIQIARSAFVTKATPLGILLFSTSGNWRGSETGWRDRNSRAKGKGIHEEATWVDW